MRELIVSEFVSLDRVMKAPGGEPGHPHSGWVFDFMSPEQESYKLDEVHEGGALLLGRVTYEGFAEAWPGRGGPFADTTGASRRSSRQPGAGRREAAPADAPPVRWSGGRSDRGAP